jgi:hypothetical protein
LAKPEFIDLVEQAYFCTPGRKDDEPVYDTTTRYLVCLKIPPTLVQLPAIRIDQFGDTKCRPAYLISKTEECRRLL